MFELDMNAIRRTAAIHSPNVANPANRLISSEGLANRWLMAANAVANSAQISQQQPKLATLAGLAISQHWLTESQISQQPDPISQQQPELAKLATLAISHDLLTTRLIAAAKPPHTPLAPDPGKANLLALVIALCDRTGVSDKARTQWLQDAEDTPPELRGDLYAHLHEQLPPALPAPPKLQTAPPPAPAPMPWLSVHQPWRTADRLYEAHHWQCPVCCAAARCRYTERCVEGQRLHDAYTLTSSAALNESNP